jgi:hypothetical protein
MSAFGNGHIMLTSSNKNLNDLYDSENPKNKENEDEYWSEQREFDFKNLPGTGHHRSNFYSGDTPIIEQEDEKIEYNSDKESKESEENFESNNTLNEEELNEQNSEHNYSSASKDSKLDIEKNLIESEQSKIIETIGEIKPNKIKENDTKEIIEYTGEHNLGSIISEPTYEMKNSAMANAQRLIKQTDSKSFLESLQKKSFNGQIYNDNMIKLVSSREEQNEWEDIDENSPKKKKRNSLYDPEEIDIPLNEKIDLMRNELEERKIITENIANNTNSSIQLNEEIRKVSDSLHNFESFSQKTNEQMISMEQRRNTLINQNNHDLEINTQMMKKKTCTQQDEDFEDLIDLSAQMSIPQVNPNKSKFSKKTTSFCEEDDNDLPINEKLKLLIQKDLSREVIEDKDYKLNLIQSSTGGHPKHNLKTQNESPVKGVIGKQSQELLKKIKNRTKETKKNFLDRRISRSPIKRKRQSQNASHIKHIQDQFSKTMCLEENQIDQFSCSNSHKKKIFSVKDFSNFDNLKINTRKSLKLNDLVKNNQWQKHYEDRKRVGMSLQLKDLYENTPVKAMNVDFKKDFRMVKSFAKSTKNVTLDFSKKSSLKLSLVDQKKKFEIKKNSLLGSIKSTRNSKLQQSKISLKNSIQALEENKILTNSNFTKRKVDSGVFDRLAKPKSSLVMLKSSRSSHKRGEYIDVKDSISQEDVILSSVQANDDKKDEPIFDSSLIKLENLTTDSQEKPHEEVISTNLQKKKINLDELIFKKKQDTEIIVEEKEKNENEPMRESIKKQKKQGKRNKKIRRRALTPYNSLKKKYRHLKPRKRVKFEITDEDYLKFLKRLERKEKLKQEKKNKSNVKKQFKNFFENKEKEDLSEAKYKLNFKKGSQTPDFLKSNDHNQEVDNKQGKVLFIK